MAYLIDSDIMVDFTRGASGAAEYLESRRGDCRISSITALELIAGARSQREVADLDILLSIYPQISPTQDVVKRAYSLLKAHAKSDGLRTLDAIIAATALGEGLTLATRNRKHFKMIAELNLDVPTY